MVAMSGGVDSSAAALLLRRAGYDCAGAMMKLYDGETAEGGCCSASDAEDARAVAARLKCPHTVLTGQLNGRETSGLMSRMTIVVSMRLHGLIFAAGHGVPLVGVVYDPKVSGFLKYIGQDLFCGLDAAGRLCERIERAAARGSSSEQETAVASLRGKEQVNREVLRRYLA